MIIYLSENNTLRKDKMCGLVTYASFGRIIEGLVTSGELTLNEGETITAIRVENTGITFQIGKIS